MRILVTGGAGYIGSVVTEELVSRGHAPVVFDDLSKGHHDAVPEGVPFVRGNLLDGALLRQVLREHEVEAVVHMAADSLVSESVTDPEKYYRSNVLTSMELLSAMREFGVENIVFSSSASVYGAPLRVPIVETDATEPTSPYGETKLVIERLLAWYAQAYRMRFVCLRYFNAAGATKTSGERHEPESHLIPIVLQTAAGLRGALDVYGDDYPTPDGTCVRDYVHVVDLARAHTLSLSAIAEGRVQTAIFNVGCGGDGYSVREVIHLAESITGRKVPTRVAPRRGGDPPVLVASSQKIVQELGWRPSAQDLGLMIQSAWEFTQARRNG